ncbi:MAG: DUF6781 family protein [Roseimicrobium sp.]
MNTESSSDVVTKLKHTAGDIVQRGKDVREEIAKLVASAAATFHQSADGLVSLAKAVTEGAAEGARRVMPEDADSLLRPVVSGLSDGFTKVAETVKLALQESTGNGTRFANEDLDKIVQDLRSVGESFVSTIHQATSSITGHVANQAKSLTDHAGKALQDMRPAIDSAIASAKQDPVKLGAETVHAGASAAREAAGVLFSELGGLLQSAGQKLRQ